MAYMTFAANENKVEYIQVIYPYKEIYSWNKIKKAMKLELVVVLI